MIQRIQTLYLAVSTALSVLLLKGHIVKFIDEAGVAYMLNYKGVSLLGEAGPELIERSLPLTILLFIVPVMFLISLFLFKNRKLQIRATVLSTLLFAGVLFLMLFYIYIAGKNLEADPLFNLKMVFPPAGVIFGYLAFRAILKDELLIKSYDRIR